MHLFKIKTTTATPLKKVCLCIGLAVITAAYPTVFAYADAYDDQINSLKTQISQYQDQANSLQLQATNLQNTISALQAQQNVLLSQISETEVQLQQLAQEIATTQQQITNQKQAITDNLKSLYIEGDITPLEMIASSKSIGDYVDKQAFRQTIQNSIQQSLNQVKALQASLTQQQAAQQKTLATQQAAQSNLAFEQQQQNQLLTQTQGQESAFQSLISQKNSEITTLRAQQAAANLAWGGGNINFQDGGGGYPSLVSRSWGQWGSSVPLDNAPDDWGMYNRECVSYAAFRVAASGRKDVPTNFGNANMWPGNARARGIPVDGTPKAGDVAVWPVGYYGHAMYVESVNGNGSILISEYNYDWTGRYSSRTISQSTYEAQGFQFIHF